MDNKLILQRCLEQVRQLVPFAVALVWTERRVMKELLCLTVTEKQRNETHTPNLHLCLLEVQE